MSKMILKDQQIGKYSISLELDNNSYGLFSRHKWIVRDFLLTISGVLKSRNTFIEEDENLISVFDNETYFKERLLVNFEYDYINTLDSNRIKEIIKNTIEKDFDTKTFKELVKETNLRNELVSNGKSLSFSTYGKTLSNFCFALSLVTKMLFIQNVDYNYTKEIKEILYNRITKKNNYDMLMIETYDVNVLSKYFNKIVLFTDYLNAYCIDPNKDTFILTSDNIKLKDKLFKVDNMVYTLNNYSKEELRDIKRYQKVKTLSFKEMIDRINELDK